MIMCQTTSNEQGIVLNIPIEHIREHKELLGDDDEKVAETVSDLVSEAARKATLLILENNWHDFTAE